MSKVIYIIKAEMVQSLDNRQVEEVGRSEKKHTHTHRQRMRVPDVHRYMKR